MEINRLSSKYIYKGAKESFENDFNKLKKNLSKQEWLLKRSENCYYFYLSTSTRGYLKVDLQLSFSELSQDEIKVELIPHVNGGIFSIIGLLIPVNLLLLLINTQNENFNRVKMFYPIGAVILVIVYFAILYNFYNTVKGTIEKTMKLKEGR